MERKLSPATVSTYMEILKVFHKWVSKGDTYPDCVKWMRCTGKKSKKLPETLLTQEDVKALLAHTNNARDHALISILWESGARIGEIGGMDIKDVAFDDFGCKIMLDGKTGMRRVRVVNSANALLNWINQHPFRNDPEYPLFMNTGDNYGDRIGHQNITKILSRTAEKAGITKPVNPHHFRHSRATYMSQFLTEAQLKEYFGWVQESKMAAQYVHLSGKQVDDAILKMHGLVKEEMKEDILKNTVCPRCKHSNDVNNSYCAQCWLPLTQQAAVEAERKKEKDQKAMVAVLKLMEAVGNDPEKLLQTIQTLKGVA